MYNLFDCKGNEINTEDIVKAENFIFGTVYYYLVGTTMMYRYNENGLFERESYNNLKIDMSVTLINDDRHSWTRLGTESEVYDSLFE